VIDEELHCRCLLTLAERQDIFGFYYVEIQAVDKSEDTLWEVEKIIRKHRRNNRTEVLVKLAGYSNRFNS
jgi:hypothetical protein